MQNRQISVKLLDALRRNPEIADFVAAYPDTEQKAFGGIRESELPEKVPLFIQWDKRWGYVPYGQSNVGISGCGPTCLSMVLYSLTGDKNLTPDMAGAAGYGGRLLCGRGGNLMAFYGGYRQGVWNYS